MWSPVDRSPVATDDRQFNALHLVNCDVLSVAVSPASQHVQPPVVHDQAEVADPGPGTLTTAGSPVVGLRVEQAAEVGTDDDDSVVVRRRGETPEVRWN